jgi:phosphatidylethanolamine/phosphatidyl-N-methylethanolamine N-methyltransferase
MSLAFKAMISCQNEQKTISAERRFFFRRWLKHPGRLGTWAPVSHALADAASRLIPNQGRVVELGAGTGRITRSILKMKPNVELSIVEIDPDLKGFLDETLHPTYPNLRIIHGNARNLDRIIDPDWVGEVDCVFSAIPLSYLPISERELILESAFSVLKPGGFVLHLTYSPLSPIPSNSSILQERMLTVWFSFPPGFIFRYRRSVPS